MRASDQAIMAETKNERNASTRLYAVSGAAIRELFKQNLLSSTTHTNRRAPRQIRVVVIPGRGPIARPVVCIQNGCWEHKDVNGRVFTPSPTNAILCPRRRCSSYTTDHRPNANTTPVSQRWSALRSPVAFYLRATCFRDKRKHRPGPCATASRAHSMAHFGKAACRRASHTMTVFATECSERVSLRREGTNTTLTHDTSRLVCGP